MLILVLATKIICSVLVFKLPISVQVAYSFEILQPFVTPYCQSFTNDGTAISQSMQFVTGKSNCSFKKKGATYCSTVPTLYSKKITYDDFFITKSNDRQQQCRQTYSDSINDDLLKNISLTTQLLIHQTSTAIPSVRVIDHKEEADTATLEAEAEKKADTKHQHEMTYYEILGVTQNATKADIKRQYLIMAKLTHPDAIRTKEHNDCDIGKNVDFSDVTTAYRTLCDPIERKKYDRTLHRTEMMQILLIVGDICLGTTLTVTEITSAIVAMAIVLLLQPIAIHISSELSYRSFHDNAK